MVNGLEDVKFTTDNPCKVCMKTKIHVKPFGSSETRSAEILEKIHSDVCGPFKTRSIGGAQYFLTFIDDKSRRVFIYFLKQKSEVLEKFKIFKEMIEHQTSKKIKVLRSDNGGEFVNKQFNEYLEQNGIIRELTVPHTPQQNGVAERANRTIVEMSRAMLLQSGLSESLWAEAVATAVYIRNRSSTKVIGNVTPYEAFTGKKPSLKHFRVFGSVAVALDKTTKRKFQPKGVEYRMVGYSLTSKAYRLYDAEKHIVVEKRDVMFIEPKNEDTKESVDMVELFENKNIVHDANNCKRQPEELEEPSSEDEFFGFDDDVPGERCNNDNTNINVSKEEENVDKRGVGRPRIIRTGRPGRPRKLKNTVAQSNNGTT